MNDGDKIYQYPEAYKLLENAFGPRGPSKLLN
jgi:hypothetical protein